MMESPTLEEKLKWPLPQKVDHALATIDQFYHTLEGKCYVAFSGGKDSTVLKFLVDKFTDMCGYARLPCVFNNTTNEYSEILEFVKSFGDEITWLRPKITFAQSLEENGFPLISKEQAQFISEAKNTKSNKLRDIRINGSQRISKSTGKPYTGSRISKKWQYLIEEDIKITSKCCDILKKRPAALYEKQTGLSPIIGTTTSESELRKQQYKLSGGKCNTFEGKRAISKPLSIFTNDDIWKVIAHNELRYCSVYDDKITPEGVIPREERTGCAYCAFGVHMEDPQNTKFHRLFLREPKRYKVMMDKLGYRNALHKIGIKLPDD